MLDSSRSHYAIAQARALDERRRNGQPIGPLHGVAVAIKDIFDTADYPTECGSPLAQVPPAGAPTAPRWRDCARPARWIIGKSVTTEFAYFHPGANAIRTIPNARPAARRRVRRRQWPPAWCRWRSEVQTNGSVIRPASFPRRLSASSRRMDDLPPRRADPAHDARPCRCVRSLARRSARCILDVLADTTPRPR